MLHSRRCAGLDGGPLCVPKRSRFLSGVDMTTYLGATRTMKSRSSSGSAKCSITSLAMTRSALGVTAAEKSEMAHLRFGIALSQARTSLGNVNSNRCPVGQILQQLESGTTSDIKYRLKIVFVRNFSGKEIDFILPAVRVGRIVEILGRQPMLIAVMDE